MVRVIARLSFCFVVSLSLCSQLKAEVTIVKEGKPVAEIIVDLRGVEGEGAATLYDSATWLAECIKQTSGAELTVGEKLGDSPSIVLARADAWPELSQQAKLKPNTYDAYCIRTTKDHVYVLGHSEAATRHGVADLLRRWGWRWFAPSPRWHVVPQSATLSIDLNVTESPTLIDRRAWYAYGMSGEDLAPLMKNYTRWAIANRLSVRSLMRTGHSYGHIVGRNKEAFAAHPEYYALLPSGKRDFERAVNARKFCFSNPGLIELVANDRLLLLEADQRANPASFMVSMDPSDGEGTCHCENCQKLGTDTDRVFHLVNAVAKHLVKTHPEAWVGLYAYSSHRLPPTIDVEPNVYVQVAMGFNKTQYTLPELIEKWSEKVGSIGLREYYGVEAWDWGLPGRMRGGQVDYHRKWIPYYADRKVNAINAETNSNWGGQTLGLYVASQLMWNPKADVGQLTDEFFQLGFKDIANTMQAFYAKLDAAPPLRSATLLPLFKDVQTAYDNTKDAAVKARLVDLMAYLVYISKYRDFDLIRSRHATRNDAYYAGLKPLMQYAFQIRHRDMVHYYALGRRLCNGLPVKDNRPEYYMFNKERDPVWMQGDALSDADIQTLFTKTEQKLLADDDPTITYSRLLNRVKPEGEDSGPSGILSQESESVARFRRKLRGYIFASGEQQVKFGIIPNSRKVEFIVSDPHGNVMFQQEVRSTEATDGEQPTPVPLNVELPRANEYRVDISGDFTLHVPPESPFVYEASVMNPAWVSYSGPHYFYVPKGTQEVIVDANPRLSLQVPGMKTRLDIHPADRKPGSQYVVVKVPDGADGQVWHTTSMTRGQVSFMNVPPLLSFHRSMIFVPREISESDGLTTK